MKFQKISTQTFSKKINLEYNFIKLIRKNKGRVCLKIIPEEEKL
jgi:hypothetical protein